MKAHQILLTSWAVAALLMFVIKPVIYPEEKAEVNAEVKAQVKPSVYEVSHPGPGARHE